MFQKELDTQLGANVLVKKRMAILLACVLSIISSGCENENAKRAPESVVDKPNVLFISVDDLNNWIGPLGGHPQAITPTLDRLASEGVNFTRAYCASPACNPSRTALLTGLHTYSSGMYSNYQVWREVLPDARTLPQYFMANGYWVAGAGKIFHNNQPDPASWNEYFPSKERHMPDYHRPKPGDTVNMPKFHNMYGDFDWSPIDIPTEETGDYRSVQWVMEQLQKEHDKPFFLAAGIYRPHVPWYVPQEYFDEFPLESVALPQVLETDLDDLGMRARDIAYRGGGYHEHVVKAGQWKRAVQGYLASIAFADTLVGKLLDALEASPHRDNTIVVLWSDHGWQLGEKEHWRKFALWENVAQSVLMFKIPEGMPGLVEGSVAGGRCNRVVSLLDIFPTLLELCGLPAKKDLDGHSLVPLLRNPEAEWTFPAITTYDVTEFSIRTEDWRYIRYIDDSEELYDHRNDPEEWTNLANDPGYATVKEEMSRHLPSRPAAFVDTSYEIMPHHFPPYRSKEDYRKRRK